MENRIDVSVNGTAYGRPNRAPTYPVDQRNTNVAGAHLTNSFLLAGENIYCTNFGFSRQAGKRAHYTGRRCLCPSLESESFNPMAVQSLAATGRRKPLKSAACELWELTIRYKLTGS
jgi:hypothetical protein